MALQYLLSPTFQFVNTAGKPMTGGAYLEVYVHGTRNKYFCASDFNGTLHPFRIPLDSLGSNIVLAQDGQAYDVYAYNRYGNLMMSRYNITPGSGGGGIGGIIYSSDGSVQVIPTDNGIDLSVNGVKPTVLKVGAAPLGTDGQFVFDLLQLEGEGLSVDNAGRIRMQPGWYHYDVTVELAWDENPRNESRQVSLYTTLSRSVIDIDLSFQHTETIQFSGDVHCVEEGAQMVFGVSGMPTGLVASVIDAGMHSITGKTGDSSRYMAGEGINIDANNYISADLDVVQHKLTAGSNIEIVGNTINATAAPQQQADWAMTDTSSPQFILNKPELASVATSGSYDDLTDKPTIPAAQVPSDWNAASGVSRILNKPDLSVYARSSDLATVATSGSYDDLSDKPTIPAAQVNADWNSNSGVTEILNKPDLGVFARSADLAEVATTGDYDDLTNKPSIPAAQVNADWNSNSGVSQILNKPDLATVATTGNYNDLSGRPTIPAAQVNADWNASSGVAEILNKPTLFSGDYDDLTDKPDLSVYAEKSELATVATSGSYDDLTDKPSIPSFTQAQQAAIDSGIDATKVGLYDTHVGDMDIHVTPADKTAWNGKQDAISDLATIRSGAAAGATAVQPSEMDAALADKQDVIQDLSTIRSGAAAGSTAVQPSEMASALADKQDVISDLSTIRSGAAAGATAVQDPDYVHTDENFTSAEKTKLSGIEAGAQVNVNADWNAASGTDAYIANKPQNLVQDASYVHTDENFTSSDKSKLAGIEAGAEVNVKPDWNAVAGSDDEILNKPSLATVATTGAFSDLSGKPTVDQTYDGTSANAQSGVAVASAIAGVNAVPASTSSDADKVLTVDAQGVPGWANAQAPISAGNGIDITNNTVSVKVDGTTVTVNGSGQLQATQPTVDQTYNSSSANAQSGTAVAGAIAGKEDEFSAGDGLEFTTDGQGNRVLQVDTPVDIVAGPGIVVDNPDGNTLRVSVAQAEEITLFEASAPTNSCTLSETLLNFEKIAIYSQTAGGSSLITLFTAENGVVNMSYFKGNNYPIYVMAKLTFNGTSISVDASIGLAYTWGSASNPTIRANSSDDLKIISKVVGIHRIAGGN